jgi:hypothetical protein
VTESTVGKSIAEQFELLLPWQKELAKIVYPELLKKLISNFNSGSKFVHYTSLPNIISMISKREIWMRKVTVMNDFRETQYGIDLLMECYHSKKGQEFRKLMAKRFGSDWEKFEDIFNHWDKNSRQNTYISCFSEHHDSEDNIGRLSMWRAYGKNAGVALVIKPDPFHRDVGEVGPRTVPVFYMNDSQFSKEFFSMCGRIQRSVPKLTEVDGDKFTDIMFEKFMLYAVATKHPGFSEEREWRIVYTPNMDDGKNVRIETEIVNGIPQRVCKFELKNNAEESVMGVEIKDFIYRIIIGPTEFSSAAKEAICDELRRAHISNPENLVFRSDIPVR